MADAHAHSHEHAEPHGHEPRGWRRFAYSTNHKDIGTLYIVFAIIAGMIGGLLSILMRLELQNPGSQFFGGDTWNVVITAHGLIMVFFVVMPALIGGFGSVLISEYSFENLEFTFSITLS